jgi:hypothetical protein
MQWLHNLNQSNVDNVISVRRAVRKLFRNKKKESRKAKIDELENNRKIKNIEDL